MRATAGSGRVMLVTTVKDEGPGILEWIAHHRRIGFTDIVVFQNNSFDTTARTLVTLDQMGVIRYFDNAFRKPGVPLTYQNRAYRRAARLPEYAACDWCMALDGDEFLQVNTGSGTVQDLIAAVGEADEVRLNWRVFGSSHLRGLDGQLVTERFTLGAEALLPGRRPVPVKTLFRTASYARPGIHIPKTPLRPDTVVRNGSGRAWDEFEVRGFQVTDPEPYRLAQVNHYMVKDSESFLVKSARGSSSHPEREIALAYWRKRNINTEADSRLAARAGELTDAMRDLDRDSGGRLVKLRNKALRMWRARVAELRAQPEMARLYEALV